MQRSNLAGYRALITGGRVKIGFETARLLLEMGAEVVVTTRFPNDALKRYSLLPCFSEAKDRLKIIGADFRSISSITNLIQVLKEKPLDILINNAAQTVRRPVPFYKHLWKAEKLPPAVEDVICQMKHIGTGENAFFPEIIGNGLNSVALSQLRILPEDNDDNNETFFRKDSWIKTDSSLTCGRITAGCIRWKRCLCWNYTRFCRLIWLRLLY